MTPTQQERRIQALYDDSTVSRRNLCERTVHLEADMEDVQAENAKLRELVRDLAICACGKYCYGCPHQYDGCDRDERIRELGIEV